MKTLLKILITSKLNYDQVPPEYDQPETDPGCNYPHCGCPHFNC